MHTSRALALSTLVLAGCASGNAPRSREADAVAIVGVAIVDPTSEGPTRSDQTILIVDGIIRAVGSSSTLVIPAGSRRVDARGKFAIPGLWDMHVHFMNTGVTALPLLLAHGVTSVREMGGYIDSTRRWQARMGAGTLMGPRIVTAGPILESPQYLRRVVERSARDPRLVTRILPYRIGVGDSASAAQAIDSLVKLRVDFVKVRNVGSPAAFYSILREARGAGLRVAAHAIAGVSVRSALDSGQSDLEHAISPTLSRLPEATRDSVYQAFARNGAWYTPTLSVLRTLILSGDSAARAIFSPDAIRLDERRAYVSPWLLEWWRMQVEERAADTSSSRAASAEEVYRSSAQDVRRMRDLGASILAGTD